MSSSYSLSAVMSVHHIIMYADSLLSLVMCWSYLPFYVNSDKTAVCKGRHN